ncbi:MAG TPA: hypothetical protein VGF17_16995 [Phytomonospora sp.]|nr:hypothetical protein [Streptomycetaceae bacterium]
MPSFASIKAAADTTAAVHKALEAVAFLAPMTVDLPTAITGTDRQPVDLAALNYWPVGLVTPDGYTFGGDVEKSEVEALGYSVPARSDIIRAPKTIAFTALESDRRHLAELLYGMDLSTVEAGPNGEITFDEPPVPMGSEYRLLVISKDGTAAAPYYRGRGYGRVKLANVPEEVWQASDPRQYPIELDVLIDDELGTPVRHYMGGQAFDATAYGYLAQAWTATTAYALGSKVRLSGGDVLEATTAGTSSSTEPTAPGTVGGTVTDGTVTWTRRS